MSGAATAAVEARGPDRPGWFSRAELLKDLRTSRASELGLDATAVHVREKLLVFANGDRETFVSVATLAAAIGRSEKTIRRALSRLYAAGEVTPRLEVTAWGRRNVYRLSGPRSGASSQPPAASAAGSGDVRPSFASGQNDPMGTDTVTRPPPADTLWSDRDHLNAPPNPPRLVVVPDSSPVAESVLMRWRQSGLPAIDDYRARVTLGRRVSDGLSEKDLLEAVDGARARSEGEGWSGVTSAFAVVMACASYVREYAERGRVALAQSERRRVAEHQKRTRERAADRAVAPSPEARAALAQVLSLAAAGKFDRATRLAGELARDGPANLAPPNLASSPPNSPTSIP